MNASEHAVDERRAERGFFPVVFGRDVHVQQGGGLIFLAKENLSVRQGGGQWMLCGGDLSVEQGGCAAMVARHARVDRGFVAAIIAGNVELGAGARVLLRATPALAAASAAAFLAGWLLGRRQSTV